MGLTGADRLLLHAADARDASVELDLARGRELQPVVDVAAALLEHLERERQPRRRAADVLQVEADVERQLHVEHLERNEADDRPAGMIVIRDRLDSKRMPLTAP